MKFDFNSENFDRFFENAVSNLTPSQRENMPHDVSRKLFKRTGVIATERVTFIQKMYILYQVIGMEVFLFVRGEQGSGIDIAQFQKQVDEKTFNVTEEDAIRMVKDVRFVVGNSQIADYVGYLNLISISKAYKYAMSIINAKRFKFVDGAKQKEFLYLTKMLVKYDSTRSKMLSDRQLTVADWYILSYLYDGVDKKASLIYGTTYKHAYGMSRPNFFRGLSTLFERGFIRKKGSGQTVTYYITELGKNEVKEIIKKYVIA